MRITAQNQIEIKPQLAALLSNLEVGDTVRAKIIELLGESIALRTASGQMFTAALMTDSELKLGQTIELVISNITEDGIFAELKPETQKPVKLAESAKLEQVLKQMDIKLEKVNIQAVKLLLKYNMPITKENVLKLINTHKSIETMAKPDMVKALSLMQAEHEIENTGFTKLAKQSVVLEGQGKQALNLLEQNMPKEQKTAINNTVLQEEASATEQQKPATAHTEAKQSQTNLSRQNLEHVTKLMDTEEVQKAAPKVDKLIDTILKIFDTAAKSKPEHSAYLISKDIDVTPAAIKALMENTDSQGKLGEHIKKLEKLVEVLEQNKADVKALKQDIYRLYLKPEALQDKEKVQEALKDIVMAAGKLEALIRTHSLEDRVNMGIFSDLKGTLDFQQNINSSINYIQIPILINDSKATADIYVFSGKKKSKAINPENASILIALDLNNLGHIESLINVNGRTVRTTFKVEKDKFKEHILDRAEDLEQALEARGYSLGSIQVINGQERFNLLELEEAAAVNPNNMHLDVKV